ncbi:MAG TPA: hypothetical protein DCF33_10110, partial [Saprospirales bacterium]|nr:hypothetical protein [Saprospirales bacterium]
MIKRSILLSLYLTLSCIVSAQLPDAKRDFQWLIGYKDSSVKTVINLFDFNQQPFEITPHRVQLGTIQQGSNTYVCDKNGQLLLYATGCNIVNSNAEIIKNGQNITPDSWLIDGGWCPDNYPALNSLLFLTDPSSDTLYYLLSSGFLPTNEWGII